MSQTTLRVQEARQPLQGHVSAPGDKSISHRALLLGAIAGGETRITGLLAADDTTATARCLRALGVGMGELDAPAVTVFGVGLRGLRSPQADLDCGNSGTTMRLLMGILAGQDFSARLIGDESLSRRPMDRVAQPLRQMGAEIAGQTERCRPPVAVRGGALRGISYVSPVASAQVKSALVLAGLYADGETSVTEPYQSRDHTERMLASFGAQIRTEGLTTAVRGGELTGRSIDVPGDLSAAAFMLVAGLLVGESWVSVARVGVNPTRTGVLDILRAMGADIVTSHEETAGGEPLATVTASGSWLHGGEIGAEIVPRLIDELPVLCVAAAVAEGTTRISGAQELRVKESDRLEAMATELTKMDARVTEQPDGLVIEGVERLRGGEVSGRGDHRVAMALAVAGLVADGETVITDSGGIATSFPGFVTTMRRLGADIRVG